MDRRRRTQILVLSVVLAHALFGVYAVSDGGFFVYGLTAPERIMYHMLSGAESHITFSGAPKYVVDDVCLQESQGSPMHCYLTRALVLSCAGGCALKTRGGEVLATEGDVFYAVFKGGVVYSDVSFRCYGQVCGVDSKLEDGRIFSSHLPGDIVFDSA